MQADAAAKLAESWSIWQAEQKAKGSAPDLAKERERWQQESAAALAKAEKDWKAGEAARRDQVQVQVEFDRLDTDLEATKRELAPAFRRLAAAVGTPNLPPTTLAGTLEQSAPLYDLEAARRVMVLVPPRPHARLAQNQDSRHAHRRRAHPARSGRRPGSRATP